MFTDTWVEIISNAIEKFQQHNIEKKGLVRKKYWNSILLGSGFLLVICLVKLVGGVIIFIHTTKPTPKCDEGNVVSTVNSIFMKK